MSGFTLLELIIVMALAAIILGLTGLRFADTVPSARLTAMASEMASTMRRLKATAEAEGKDERFIVDFDKRRYGVQGKDTRPIPGGMSVLAEDTPGTSVRTGRYIVLFGADGGMEGGRLVLSYGGRSVAVEADPVLGAKVERQ